MGLLTDPGTGCGKFAQLLINYHGRLCMLLYIIGVVLVFLLASEQYSSATYFSENALLPGLVKGEYNEEFNAKSLLKELTSEAERYPDDLPYSWLQAKMKQMGLEVFTHNFTLNYPMGLGRKFSGKNVYGIIRATRSASTEALLLTVPFRPLNTAYYSTLHGLALGLSLVKFFRRKKYWAKDIIFLVTQHEQLGVQAWLEAYHQVSCGKGILVHGDLAGRSGAIQAAINLELYGEQISHLNVKIEGLNGQLPNLDLINVVNRMANKEGIHHTIKNMRRGNSFNTWSYSFNVLLTILATQAPGVPDGNHGLFHRFGIEAVTIEGFETESKSGAGFYEVGRVIEGVFRSLNNLLERFHQSFFFYILISPDRYISIGFYIPCIGIMAGSLLIKAYACWLKMNNVSTTNKIDIEQNESTVFLSGTYWLFLHIIGIIALSTATSFSYIGLEFALITEDSVFVGFLCISIITLLIPIFTQGKHKKAGQLLYIVTLLELAIVLMAIAIQNFALSIIIGLLYVPLALNVYQLNKITKFLWIFIHPLSLMILVIAATLLKFPTEQLSFAKLMESSKQALMFSIVDYFIYGNWIIPVASVLILPIWTLFWSVTNFKQ